MVVGFTLPQPYLRSNCVVRGDWDRYEYYLMLLDEAIARQEALQQQPDSESSLKAKIKSGGKQKLEPKLVSKKYRRYSRRLQHQQLQDLCEELDELCSHFLALVNQEMKLEQAIP